MNRPRTASTGASTGESGNTIVAISESRGINCEIGLISLNLTTMHCSVLQYIDTANYTQTAHHLNLVEPSQVLLSGTCTDETLPSRLYQALGALIEGVVVSIKRSWYSDTIGLEMIRKYSVKNRGLQLLVDVGKQYFALSAISALFTYLEEKSSISFKGFSIQFQVGIVEGRMLIDMATARNLELTVSKRESKVSLFGVLNYCETAMGARLLRSSILKPVIDIALIKSRQEAVSELLQNEELSTDIGRDLGGMPDIEVLISSFIQIPRSKTTKFAEQSINRIIRLKLILQQTVRLSQALEEVKSPILHHIHQALLSPLVAKVQDRIEEVVNSDITYQKSSLGLRNQRCYTVRAGFNGLLDVARQTYKEATDDAHEMVIQYAGKTSLSNVEESDIPIKITYSVGLGFYMSAPVASRLPDIFINVVRKNKIVTFTTLHLTSLNERINESLSEVYVLSEDVVVELLVFINDNVSLLYMLAESVAMLDFLASLANYATLDSCVLPEFTETLALKNARHPYIKVDRVVPNDTFADQSLKMQFITGPNLAGKSTYVNQIALIHIMAQIGSYVPCDYCILRITDKILTRIGHDQGAIAHISSFTREMADTAFILDQITDTSLVIIDELGRGTSTSDAISISIAVTEALLRKNAFCFFATHFDDVVKAFSYHANVASLNLSTTFTTYTTYDYKVKNGICEILNYGLDLAARIGFPESVLEDAKKVSLVIEEDKKRAEEGDEFVKARQGEMLVKMAVDIVQVVRSCSLPEDGMVAILADLQSTFAGKLSAFLL